MNTSPRGCLIAKLGVFDYLEALSLQKKTRQMRCENKIDDVLLLLEHPHVITIGAGGSKADLLIPEETLNEKGIAIFKVKRGGQTTYHGPGQLVGYPIIDLSNYFRDIHLYLRGLEEVIILTLRDYGMTAKRINGLPGVWVGDKEIAAIGVEIRKWVTMHGFALNVNADLSFFSYFVPCGMKNKGITSMLASSSPRNEVHMADVYDNIAKHFAEVFGMSVCNEVSLDELENLLQ
jgi:lipoyl(octanoyl) transferase